MPITYRRKNHKQKHLIYTLVAVVSLLLIFTTMATSLYITAEEEAYENLHAQTKQIKDDITLQLISDRENLATMANFAATLYKEEERYDIMFQSFKPIGLIENIGILNEDNTFVTKAGNMDVSGYLSFEEEAKKGAYISSRVSDITTKGKEIVRSAVPIKSGDKVVGILYGVIQLEKIGQRYNQMAKDIDAQLFIYHKETGDLIVDNIHSTLGNISFLKDRQYNDGFSYEQMATTPNGFTSFMSAYRNENAYLHYSTIEELDLMIAMARYDSQVFAGAQKMTHTMMVVSLLMLAVISIYILALTISEKQINDTTACASDVRKILLETSGETSNIEKALELTCNFARAEAMLFFDIDEEEYSYTAKGNNAFILSEEDRRKLRTELFKYTVDLQKISSSAVNILCIKPNKHLYRTNPTFYEFLKQHKINDLSLSATINNSNFITALVAINSKRGNVARLLAEKVSACFSMALYNKNYLHKTKLVATTDSLTGALNRVAYNNDLAEWNQTQPTNFSCIYVDVNELHIMNNKFGHAAGDEMLIYISNSLKEIFYGHKVYRMGGDEFVVFCQGVDHDIIKKNIEIFKTQIETRNYHVAIGLSYRTRNVSTEEMVKEAEVRMYETKAQYYQNKDQKERSVTNNEYVQVKTGIREIDTILSILNEKYNGIYRVSLDTDEARRILMPAYLHFNEHEKQFSVLFSHYVAESIESDYQRAVMSFLNYDALKHQLADGQTPRITFKKNNGETVSLSVYKLCDESAAVSDTLWVFAKD